MHPGLQIGHTARLAWPVTADRTIALGAHAPHGAVVFSTPAMINLMEHAARRLLEPFLEPGEESVGIDVQVTHTAATPIGATVEAQATVTALEGRTIGFEVTARDEREPIGHGAHRRAIIPLERFAERLRTKQTTMPTPFASPAPAGPLPAFQHLEVRLERHIAHVTLNRPAQLNVLNRRLTDELGALTAWLAGHAEEARVVLLSGAGKAFCAGNDLKEIAALPADQSAAWNVQQGEITRALREIPQPIIAAIGGYALGGGLILACCCDYRLASRTATFGLPEITHGWPPSFGLAQLIAAVGPAAARQLALGGETFGPERALALGIVSQVTAPAMLMGSALQLARRLAGFSSEALGATKRLLTQGEGAHPASADALTNAAYLQCLATPTARAALDAFLARGR
jgi:enoyl-CoA hydratase/carnithine racemase/predicted thioesterase